MQVDHGEYLRLLQKLRAPGVKQVFIRSGIRYDYLMEDPDDSFSRELVAHHVSGQLKVAPEHCSPRCSRHGQAAHRGLPSVARTFYAMTKRVGKEQYLVPYLMSSHPGSTLKTRWSFAFLKKGKTSGRQVQDFYPTPGTVSTCMFYTGLDPYTMKEIFVPRTAHEKAVQRALLQYFNPPKTGRWCSRR